MKEERFERGRDEMRKGLQKKGLKWESRKGRIKDGKEGRDYN